MLLALQLVFQPIVAKLGLFKHLSKVFNGGKTFEKIFDSFIHSFQIFIAFKSKGNFKQQYLTIFFRARVGYEVLSNAPSCL